MAADSRLIPLVFAAILAATAADGAADAALPAPGTYRLDPMHTFVGFKAQHFVVGAIRGRLALTTGTVVVTNDPAECTVEVSIDAGSLSTGDPLRDGEVKGADFLDAEHFPLITWRGAGMRRGPRGWVVDGTLTIRGVARSVPVEFTFAGTAPRRPGWPPRLGFHASAAVQRSAFGMIRELRDQIGIGGKDPDVWIEIDTEALLQIPALSARGEGG